MLKKKTSFLPMIFLISIGIILPALILNSNSVLNSDKYTENHGDNKSLKLAIASEKIHIDNNWSDAKVAGICTGDGVALNPYVIEDLEINGGGSGDCITIENSDVYFKIENCTLYNARDGISLYYVTNGQLIDNNCSYVAAQGIFLRYSHYNTVTGNTANNNADGIFIMDSHNNTVSGNTANNNNVSGISIFYSDNNTIIGNSINRNKWGLWIFSSDYNIIRDNTLIENTHCILEEYCEGNKFENIDCREAAIPGYSILFLLSILALAVVNILRKKLKKSNNFNTLDD